MNRRGFLKGAAVAASAMPVMASVAVGKPHGSRISVEKDDEGYRAYCLACGDNKKIKVFLDGAHQKGAVTADERTGMVKRIVYTDAGNIAHDGDELLFEEVYGDVRVVIS